ncbi:MAG: hypothetical protein ACYDA3_10195 [Gaiellaceae bacterium]
MAPLPKARGSQRAGAKVKTHANGFEQAFDKAVDAAAKKWPKGKHRATVLYQVEIEIVNPGSVGDYIVVLQPLDG